MLQRETLLAGSGKRIGNSGKFTDLKIREICDRGKYFLQKGRIFLLAVVQDDKGNDVSKMYQMSKRCFMT